jgi:hypothetical protein
MVENGGTGASSTGKSLLETLHEAGGGEEAWEAQNKITESDAAYGKGIDRACRGARTSLGTLSVSALSPCAVMSTDSLLPAMMIPGGIMLVPTLCIIMPLHQVALTVFLPRRPAHRRRRGIGGFCADYSNLYAICPAAQRRCTQEAKVAEQHCPPAGTDEEKSQRCAQLDPAFPQKESPGEAQGGEKVQLE